MIIIFTGPPLAGKGTQAQLLGERLNIPVISIGKLLREGDKKAQEGYKQYAMKGHNLPTDLKFGILREKIDQAKNGYILENFPATKEDLDVFSEYLVDRGLAVNKVFHIQVSEEEIKKRMSNRGRIDDTEDIVQKRKEIQDRDRIPVLDYFRQKGIVEEINGEQDVEEVQKEIVSRLGV